MKEEKSISLEDVMVSTSDRKSYYNSEGWKRKVSARLEIDGYKCVLCGSTQNLQVHHRSGDYSTFGNEDVINDLITLCSCCHGNQPSSKISVLLEEGLYTFEVISYTESEYKGSEKLPPCTSINLNLNIYDSNGKRLRRLYYDLRLAEKLKWKIENFFKAVDLPISGITYRENFQNSIGRIGICKIVQYQTQNGSTSNRVEDFCVSKKIDINENELPY